MALAARRKHQRRLLCCSAQIPPAASTSRRYFLRRRFIRKTILGGLISCIMGTKSSRSVGSNHEERLPHTRAQARVNSAPSKKIWAE
jgi:hypothetical protein